MDPKTRDNHTGLSKWSFAFRLLVQESDGYLRTLMTLVMVLVVATSAVTVLSPILLKLIVDRLSTFAPLDAVYLAVGALVVGYSASQWLVRTFGDLRSWAAGRADERLHRRLSARLYKHVLALPLRFHLDRKIGALNQTLTNGLLGYRILVQHLVTSVLPVVLELAAMSTVLVILGQPIFLAIIGATSVCYTVAFYVGAVRLTGPARAASTSSINATATLTDSLINYEAIKSFCAESRMHQRMEGAFAETEAHWARFLLTKALNGAMVGTIFALSLGTSMLVAAREVRSGHMTVGDFVLVNAYMLQIFAPMEKLGFAFRDLVHGMAFVEKMIGVFRKVPEAGTQGDGKPVPPGRGELVFDQVSFSYNKKRPILRDVSFRVPAGKTVALVGKSGAGKSSLIRLLLRFWDPDCGQILIDGMPIHEATITSLRQAIAVVPQDTVLFNDTIAYNISVGGASSEKDIMEAARVAHIHDFIAARPDGYDTQVGERGLKLSGGEKQRIAIARAALKQPRLFVFDEATSSLDSKTEQQILRNIAEVSHGTTTLVIAHRLSTIVDADEIVALEDGRIVERGTHQELIQRNGLYREMWVAQQKKKPSRTH